MVLHFLDISTLSLEGVLDVNQGDLVDFFKIQPIAKRALHHQRNQFERAIRLSPHVEACRCR